MVDYVHITVKAGDGGEGRISFRTQKGKPVGVPDGGDGGSGGNVYIVSSEDLNTLAPYRYKKYFEAQKGVNGGKNSRTGAHGQDLLLEVPLGTLIKDDKNELIFDLTEKTDKVMVAQGGQGGRGNEHLKHLIRERREEGERGVIRVHEKGQIGERFEIILELKVLADVGLIGFPNAGKSTLLSVLTAAKPKIANYPFTTLEPNLGVFTHNRQEIVLADIPGLIEGASLGKGLGEAFLRHVERTRLLLHLVSLESTTPLEDLKTINQELKNYSEELTNKPQLIILTKIDLIEPEKVEQIKKIFKSKKLKVIAISSVTGIGIDELKKELVKRF